MADTKLLVLTGGRGEIARAIQARALDMGWRVRLIERGDDLDAAVAEADAVLVLEAARPQAVSTDYRMALWAVAAAVDGALDKTFASITMLPPHRRWRDAFLELASAAEAEVRAAHPGFTAIRASLVVGTPRRDGPSDAALRANGPSKGVPAPGTQKVRPIVIDDLAKVALATLEPPDEDCLVAEGPAELTLDDLVKEVNGDRTSVWHYPSWLRTALAVVAPWLAHRGGAQLPAGDFVIGPENPTDEILGVPLTTVEHAWPDEARQGRARRERQRHYRKLYRATRASGVVAAFLIALGLVAIAVGLHDAAVTTTLAPRMSGVVLIVAGAFVAGCGGALLARYWKHRYTAGFLGSAVALVMVTVLLLTALVNGDAPLWAKITGGYLILAALTACVSLWRRGHLAVAEFFKRGGVGRVSAIVLGSTVIGVVQFLYAAIYVPSTATPTVNISAGIEPGAPSDDRRPVTLTFTIKNPTSHSVNVLAGSYEVDALDAVPGGAGADLRDPEAATQWKDYIQLNERVRMDANEHHDRPHVVEVGNAVTAGTFLEPGEQLDRKVVVYAPTSFRTLRAHIDLVLARRRFEDQLDLSFQVMGGERPMLDAVQEIHDPSLVHRATRGQRYIHVLRSLDGWPLDGCDGLPLVVYIDNQKKTDAKNGACSERADDLAKHYGITSTETIVETTRGEDAPPPDR